MKPSANFLIQRLPGFCLFIFVAAATIGVFTGGIWATLGLGGAIVMFAAIWRIEGRAPLPTSEVLIFVLSALWVFAILNFQSSQTSLSWAMWEQLATIFLPLCVYANASIQKRAASPRLFKVLPVAAAIGALALGVELSLHGPLLKLVRGPAAGLFQYNRGFSYLVVLGFPIMAGLWVTKRRWLILLFILILLLPASLTESRAAKLAVVLGLLTALAAHLLPLMTRRSLMALSIVAIGWPFAVQQLFLHHHKWIESLPSSWQDRMELWDYMSYRILERPIFGWGLGSSPTLPLAEPHGSLYRYELVSAPHPHNAIIQLWVELGLPGLAFGLIFAFFMLNRAGRLPHSLMPFAMGAWMAAFCLAMISYNFWTDSLWSALALTAFAFALLQRQKKEPGKGS